eukprot:10137-Heterococcus_DN1.PRE.1
MIRFSAGETDCIVPVTIMTHHAKKRIAQRGLSMKDKRASVVRDSNVVITVIPNKIECIGERFMAIVLKDLEWTGKHRGYLVKNSKTHSRALMQVSLTGCHYKKNDTDGGVIPGVQQSGAIVAEQILTPAKANTCSLCKEGGLSEHFPWHNAQTHYLILRLTQVLKDEGSLDAYCQVRIRTYMSDKTTEKCIKKVKEAGQGYLEKYTELGRKMSELMLELHKTDDDKKKESIESARQCVRQIWQELTTKNILVEVQHARGTTFCKDTCASSTKFGQITMIQLARKRLEDFNLSIPDTWDKKCCAWVAKDDGQLGLCEAKATKAESICGAHVIFGERMYLLPTCQRHNISGSHEAHGFIMFAHMCNMVPFPECKCKAQNDLQGEYQKRLSMVFNELSVKATCERLQRVEEYLADKQKLLENVAEQKSAHSETLQQMEKGVSELSMDCKHT